MFRKRHFVTKKKCTPPRNWGVPGKNISRRRAPKNKSRGSLLTLKVWWKTAQWRNQQRRQIWPGKYDLAAAVYFINLWFLFHFTIECFVTEVKFWAGVKIRAEVRFGGKEEGEADNMASQLLAVQMIPRLGVPGVSVKGMVWQDSKARASRPDHFPWNNKFVCCLISGKIQSKLSLWNAYLYYFQVRLWMKLPGESKDSEF